MKRLYLMSLSAVSRVFQLFGPYGLGHALRLISAAILVLAWFPAQATSYKFPSDMPPGCTGKSGNYTCPAGTLGYADDYVILGTRPATITFNGSVSTNANTINTQGSASDLTIVVTGTLNLSHSDQINANITAGSINDSNGSVTLGGSLNTTSGTVTLNTSTNVGGSITTTSGAIVTGQNGVIGGSITSSSGSVSVGYAGHVNGSINTGGDTLLAQNAVVAGGISSSSGVVNVGYGAQVNGSVSTGGAITLAQSAVVSGSITGTTSHVDIAYGATVKGPLTTSTGTITFGQNSVALSCVKSTGSAAITLGPQAAINSVCCGGSCSNSCVANNTQGTMPPACPGTAMDHYELSLPTSSVTCLPTTVSVTACTNSSSPCTSAATTVSGQSATLSSGTTSVCGQRSEPLSQPDA